MLKSGVRHHFFIVQSLLGAYSLVFEDVVHNKILAVVIFVACYLLLFVFPKWRVWIAIFCGLLFVSLGILSFSEILDVVDYGVLMMIGGSMGLVALFVKSGMPALLAEKLLRLTKNHKWAIIALASFAGLISAFVDNVATVLMVAPIALELGKKTNSSPVPSVIAIAVASNLQGAATLVGDTTSIMLGGYLDMSFLDFFVYNGRLSLFFIVQLSAIFATSILLCLFRNARDRIEIEDTTEVRDYFPSILLLSALGLLIALSFVRSKPSYTMGVVTVGLFLIGLIYDLIRYRQYKITLSIFKSIDFATIGLLFGLFLLIGGIRAQGLIDDFAQLIVGAYRDNLFLLYTIIVFGSVLISALVDNIPYVATMLPVVDSIGTALGGDITVLFFGLLAGATLGGNITPIGSSANLAAIGLLDKSGYKVPARQFVAISAPYTLVAVLTGYISIWVLFAP